MTELHRMHRVRDVRTSKTAAQQALPFAPKHETAILRVLRDAFPRGLTAEEIGDRTGLGHVPVNRRLASMKDRELICRTGEERRNRNGRPAKVWTIWRLTGEAA